MDPWITLEVYLDGVLRQVEGDAYVLLDWTRAPLLPWIENVHFIEEFAKANEILDSLLGRDVMKLRASKRYVHEAPGLRFVAEPLLSAYLLIVVFTDRFQRSAPPDLARIVWTLDKVHSKICTLIRGLTPEGGGGGPSAAAQRLPRP